MLIVVDDEGIVYPVAEIAAAIRLPTCVFYGSKQREKQALCHSVKMRARATASFA